MDNGNPHYRALEISPHAVKLRGSTRIGVVRFRTFFFFLSPKVPLESVWYVLGPFFIPRTATTSNSKPGISLNTIVTQIPRIV